LEEKKVLKLTNLFKSKRNACAACGAKIVSDGSPFDMYCTVCGTRVRKDCFLHKSVRNCPKCGGDLYDITIFSR